MVSHSPSVRFLSSARFPAGMVQLLIIGCVFVGGCAPAWEKEREKVGDRSSAASESAFLPRLVPGMEGQEHLPGSLEEALQNHILNGNYGYEFKHVIPLPAPGAGLPLFLVWPEKVNGVGIRSAQGVRAGAGEEPESLSFDPDTKRWFIPVAQLVGSSGLDPDRRWAFEFEFRLISGKEVAQKLVFRVTADISALKVSRRMGEEDQLRRWSSAVRNPWQGYVLSTETLRNPSHKEVSVHFRAESEVEFWTLLKVPRYSNASKTSLALRTRWEQVRSRALFDRTLLRVRRSSAVDPEVLDLSKGDGRVRLRAYEEVELEWVIAPAVKTSKCRMPAPQKRVLKWIQTEHLREFGWKLKVPYEKTLAETWSAAGHLLIGNFEREAWVIPSSREGGHGLIQSRSNRTRTQEGDKVYPLLLPEIPTQQKLESGELVLPSQLKHSCHGLF